jgi:amino acid transporter
MKTSLNRSLGFWPLVFYGTGTILGAGIYVLVGEIARSSGKLSALSFLVAALIVAFSAYSFALLAKRFPSSAGPAAYVQAAFGYPWLSILTGYSIVFMGITSSATIAQGFLGYFGHFISAPEWLVASIFVAVLTGVAIRGVGFSVGVAVAATLIEIAGLIIVIVSARHHFGIVVENPGEFFLPLTLAQWSGIGLGAYLAFYACIGFEDMVSMVEEVKEPGKNMVRAIATVLVVTTLLYVLVALAAITSAPIAELANSPAPLALVIERNGLVYVEVIGIISAIAVTNGALIQIIMGSRVLYGMANRKLAHRGLASVHPISRIPRTATLVVGALVLVFTLLLPLATLAKTTSTIVLSVFTLVNLSLLKLSLKDPEKQLLPIVLPTIAALICLVFMGMQLIL